MATKKTPAVRLALRELYLHNPEPVEIDAIVARQMHDVPLYTAEVWDGNAPLGCQLLPCHNLREGFGSEEER